MQKNTDTTIKHVQKYQPIYMQAVIKFFHELKMHTMDKTTLQKESDILCTHTHTVVIK